MKYLRVIFYRAIESLLGFIGTVYTEERRALLYICSLMNFLNSILKIKISFSIYHTPKSSSFPFGEGQGSGFFSNY